MSTKKLSRTVIEGGRYGSNKYERRQSHAQERAAVREYCRAAIIDPELVDDQLDPAIKPVYKEFSDKLSPMYAWLDAQVGRPWSEVRSEVFQKFDTRTTAGRHITFDHLLREVVDTESGFDHRGKIADPTIPKEPSGRRSYWSSANYWVDQNGNLQTKKDHYIRHHPRYEFVSEQEYKNASHWLNSRMIGEIDGKLYWFVPTEGIWIASWHNLDKPYEGFSFHNKLHYFIRNNGMHEIVSPSLIYPSINMTGKVHGDYWELVESPFSFRQRGELTAEETKQFKSLKEKIRDDILAYGKGR